MISSKSIKFSFLILLIGFICIVGTGCDRQPPLPADIQEMLNHSRQDCLRIGLSRSPGFLNPLGDLSENSPIIVSLIHAGPLRKLPDGRFVGDLWESWEVSQAKDNPEDLQIEGIWRSNLKWHDGTEFSISDFDFTLAVMKKPENRSPYRFIAEKVKSIEHVANNRTRIVFSGNSRQYLELLCAGLVPQHLVGTHTLESVTVKTPSGIEGSNYGVASGEIKLFSAPPGLGPYKIARLRGRRFMLLELVRPDFIASLAEQLNVNSTPFSKILFHYVYAPEDMVESIRRRQLDWTIIPSEYADKMEELKIPGVKFIRHPNPARIVLGLNCRRGLLARKEFRQALNLAIDRQKFKQIIPYEGSNKVFIGNDLATSEIFSLPASPDIVRAKNILKDLGLKDDNSDGVLEYEGKPITIEILVNQENLLRKMIAESIISDFRSIGIKGQIVQESWGEMVGKRLEKSDFDAFVGSILIPRDCTYSNLFHSKSDLISGGINYFGFSDEHLDKLIEKLERYPPSNDIAATRKEVENIIWENMPIIFLFVPQDCSVVSDSLEGPDPATEVWEQTIFFWKKHKSSSSGKKS